MSLNGPQRVRCHDHIDVGIETSWHAEGELQSNLRVQRRGFLRSSGNVKLSHGEFQHVPDLELHQVTSKQRQSVSTSNVTPTPVTDLRNQKLRASPNTKLYDLNGCPNGPARTLSMVPGSMSMRIA